MRIYVAEKYKELDSESQDKLEKLLNLVIEELSNLKVPIVFKGGMVTKFTLKNKNNVMNRNTKDIDGDYIETENVSMELLKSIVEKAVKQINKNYEVEIFREFGDSRAAGFLVKENNERLFSIDISVRKNPYTKIYLWLNEVPIIGQKEIKMVVDKLSVISSKKIYRRAQDLVDLYNLIISIEDIKLQEIFQISKESNKEIGNFEEFLNELDKVEHAYSKLRGIFNKKNFKEVYKLLMI